MFAPSASLVGGGGYLSDSLSEEDAEHIIELVSSFDILGVVETPEQRERLYFNHYQFGDKAGDIAKALPMLSDERREELDVAIGQVGRRPGLPLDDLKVSESTKGLAVGVLGSWMSLKSLVPVGLSSS